VTETRTEVQKLTGSELISILGGLDLMSSTQEIYVDCEPLGVEGSRVIGFLDCGNVYTVKADGTPFVISRYTENIKWRVIDCSNNDGQKTK